MTYLRPASTETNRIVSAYNKTNVDYENTKDILFMFESIPITLWIIVLACFIVFVTVLKFGHRLSDRDSKSHYLWLTVCTFLDQDNFPNDQKYVSVLSVFMSIGIFFAINYLTSCATTDLVVISSPISIKDYDDVINRNIKVMCQINHAPCEKLLQSENDSREKMLMKNYFPLPTPFMESFQYINNQSAVLFGGKSSSETLSYFFLIKYRANENIRILISFDPGSKSHTEFFFMNKHMDKNIAKLIHRA